MEIEYCSDIVLSTEKIRNNSFISYEEVQNGLFIMYIIVVKS